VPWSITLDGLHAVIQAAFGWESYHLHVFETADRQQYGDPDPELDFRSEYGVRLTRVAPVGHKLRYTYDFGDNWEHVVEIERSLPAEPAVTYPRCVGGRRAAPPEDCGGIWGYQELLERRVTAPDDEDELSMLPEDFDPSVCDRDEVDTLLAGLAGGTPRDR
jgi:Plasmid pRiA4b ORF-3-like protein